MSERNIRINIQAASGLPEVADQYEALIRLQREYTATVDRQTNEIVSAIKEEGTAIKGVTDEMKRQQAEAAKAAEHRSEVSKIKGEYDNLGSSVRGLTTLLAAAFTFSEIKQFGTEVIEAKSKIDGMKIALDQLLGSKRESAELYAQLVTLAKQTPFELQDVVDQTVKLKAYGIATSDLIPTITALGNMASVVGTDKLPQLTLAYGQVATKGRLMGDELRQFTEAGIPMFDLLAEAMKKPKDEVIKMAAAHEIAFADIRKAVLDSSEVGGRYYQLMQLQAKTLGGEVSNLADKYFIAKARVGDFFEDEIRAGIRFLGDLTDATIGSNSAIQRTVSVITSAASAWVSAKIALNLLTAQKLIDIGATDQLSFSQKLLTLNTETVAAASATATGGLRALWAAMAANPIGAILTVVSLAVSAFTAWQAATEDVTVAMGEQEFSLRKEQLELNNTVDAVLRAKSGTQQRADAMQLLINKFPDYFAGLDAEKTTNSQLAGILNQVNQTYSQRISLAQTAYKADQLSGKLRETFDEEAKVWERLKKVLSPEELKMMNNDLENYLKLPANRLMELNSSVSSLWQGMLGRQVKEVIDSRKDMESQLKDLDKERLDNVTKQNESLIAAENKRHETVMTQLKAANKSTAGEEQLHTDNLAKINGTYREKESSAVDAFSEKKKEKAKLSAAEIQQILAQEHADTYAAKLKALKEQEDVEIQAANKAAANKRAASEAILAIHNEFEQKRAQLEYETAMSISKSITEGGELEIKTMAARSVSTKEAAKEIKASEKEIQDARKETAQIVKETGEIEKQSREQLTNQLVQIIGQGNQLAAQLAAFTIKAIQDVDMLTGKTQQAAQSRLDHARLELSLLKSMNDENDLQVQARIANQEKVVAQAQQNVAKTSALTGEALTSIASLAVDVISTAQQQLTQLAVETGKAIADSVIRTRDSLIDVYDTLMRLNEQTLETELENYQDSYQKREEIINAFYERQKELSKGKDLIDAQLTYAAQVVDINTATGEKLSEIWDFKKGAFGINFGISLIKMLVAWKQNQAEQEAASEQRAAREQQIVIAQTELAIEQAKRLRDERIQALQDELDAFIASKDAEQAKLEETLAAEKAANEQFYSDKELRLQADEQYRAQLLAQGEAREVAALQAAMGRELARASSAEERTRIVNAFEQLIAEVHAKYQDAIGNKTKEISLANTEAKAQEADKTKQLETSTTEQIKALKDQIAAKEAATTQQMKQAQADYANFVNAAQRQIFEATKQMKIAELRAEIAILRGKRNLFNRGKIDSAIDDLNAAIGDIESISFDSGGVSAGGSGGSSGGGNTATPATPEQIKSEYDAKKAEQATAYQQIYNAGEEINALNDPNGSDMPRRQFLENFIQQQQQILSQLSQQLGQLEQKMRELGIPFKDGTDYVRGEGFPDGIDTVMARLTKGERVLTVDQNRALSGISNEELVSRMQSYETIAARFPQLISPESYRIPDTTIRLPEGIVSALDQPTLDLSPLREDLRSVAEALARQKQLNVSIDKNGFVLSETGTQSTTTYHQNLMNR